MDQRTEHFRTSASEFRRKGEDVRRIGHELNVGAVLEGSGLRGVSGRLCDDDGQQPDVAPPQKKTSSQWTVVQSE